MAPVKIFCEQGDGLQGFIKAESFFTSWMTINFSSNNLYQELKYKVVPSLN